MVKFVKKTYSKKNLSKKTYDKKKLAKGSAKPVMMTPLQMIKLKQVMDVEKKRAVSASPNPYVIGQVLGSTSGGGVIAVDCTPVPVQGDGQYERIGNTIKLTSTHFDFLFRQQVNTNTVQNGIIDLFMVKGGIVNPASEVAKIYESNPFIASYNAGTPIYDTSCTMNMNYASAYTLLRRKHFKIRGDNLVNTNQEFRVSMGLKYKNHNVKFNFDGTNVPSHGQLFFVIRMERGNADGTNVSYLNYVPDTNVSSGVFMDFAITHWFQDS